MGTRDKKTGIGEIQGSPQMDFVPQNDDKDWFVASVRVLQSKVLISEFADPNDMRGTTKA